MADETPSGEMHRLLAGADESTKRRVREIRARLEARVGEPIAPADLERALWLAAARKPEALREQVRSRRSAGAAPEPERLAEAIEEAFSRDAAFD